MNEFTLFWGTTSVALFLACSMILVSALFFFGGGHLADKYCRKICLDVLTRVSKLVSKFILLVLPYKEVIHFNLFFRNFHDTAIKLLRVSVCSGENS